MKTTVGDLRRVTALGSHDARAGARGRTSSKPVTILIEPSDDRDSGADGDGRKRSIDPGASILAFSGSSRRGSYNKRLLDLAVHAGRALDGQISILDLRDLELPIYDGDDRFDGIPDSVLTLRRLVAAHDGFLIVSPEYNGSLPPILKNALDWCSRTVPGTMAEAPFRGKVATIMSASPVLQGGACCLDHLRLVLSRMGMLVLPEELCLSDATSAFSATELADPGLRDVLNRSVAALLGTLRMCRSGACVE